MIPPDGLHSPEGLISIVFVAGSRPCVADIEGLLADGAAGLPQAARISHREGAGADWVEILASGLVFDLDGLQPGSAARLPPNRHFFGVPADIADYPLEAITLKPGEHIAAAGAMLPVARVICGLAASLSTLKGVSAVCWRPAGSWMDPAYFSRITGNWLGGGAFPALGLVGLDRTADGGMESDGLAHFIGQELRVDGRPGEAAPDTVKLSVRVMDALVQHGRVADRVVIKGAQGENLVAQADGDGRLIRLWRKW